MDWDYIRPTTLAAAFEARRMQPDAKWIAGGTDFIVRVRRAGRAPRTLISLRAIPGLSGVTRKGERDHIGALTTIAALLDDAELCSRFPVLAAGARALGSMQIRNVATIGGNLCNAAPCADTAPPLLVLDAVAEITGPGGRREIALSEFFTGPGTTALQPDELLTAVSVEQASARSVGVFLKRGRVAMDIATASVAMQLEIDRGVCTRARVAAGSVAPMPLRLREAEAILEGSRLDDAALERAASAAMSEVRPITDIRSTEDYRRRVVGAYVKRAARRIAQGAVT